MAPASSLSPVMPITAAALPGSALAAAPRAPSAAPQSLGRIKATAEEFEQVYVSTTLAQMFSGVQGEGPLGVNGTGGDVWRSYLTDQYAHQITKAGGFGIARQVMQELIKLQEAR